MGKKYVVGDAWTEKGVKHFLKCDLKGYLFCCGSKNGSEIDGQEFETDDLTEFIERLQKYKEVHVNYIGIHGKDLDLWVKLV